METTPDEIARRLNAQRDSFKAFLVSRLGNRSDAEDILQDGLLKAIRHADEIKDADRAPAWFFRLLRNSIIDFHRARSATAKRHDKLGATLASLGEDIAPAPNDWDAQICACLNGVIDTMKPTQAELIRRVDLENKPVAATASELGLSPNNASVTLHRARKELRLRLEAFCGACASDACLDCHCQPTENA